MNVATRDLFIFPFDPGSFLVRHSSTITGATHKGVLRNVQCAPFCDLAFSRLQGGSDQLSPSIRAVGFGPFDGRSDGAIDDDLGQHADGSRDSKEDRIIAGLGQSVVL